MFEKLEIPSDLIPSDPRFGSGPSLVPTKHLKKLAETGDTLLGTSHRQARVKNLVKELQEGLKSYFNLPSDYEVVLGNGGATFSWDMIGLGMTKKSSYHNVCGEFSSKWFKAHKNIPWIEAKQNEVDFGQGIHPKFVEGYDLIALTLNETSTGVQMTTIPDVPSSADTLLSMDATSGAGQIKVDISKIDYYYFSPQKVFAAEGGLYVGFLSPKAKERVLKIQEDKSRYVPVIMDWNLAIDNSSKNQTYNTPSLANLFLLNEQVKLMNELGEDKVCEMAEAKAQHIYGWASEKPYLECYIADHDFRSRSVATINVDESIPVGDLTKKLREMGVVIDIDAYRKLGKNQFRIALFHNITLENLEKLTQLLSMAIESEL